ncbi:MAG: glycine betaine ABC transporter substrate-binding protein [Solirubrobacteraceae bacterium]
MTMFSPRLAINAGRLLTMGVIALGCAACGNAGTSTTTVGRPGRASVSGSATTRTVPATSTAASTTAPAATTTTTATLPGTGRPAITVGDKNYTEQFVLGQLYVQALRAQGYTVNINQNIGPTQVTVLALKAGTLSMYPEYLNVFNAAIAGDRRHFPNVVAAYQAAQQYAIVHGLQLLAPTPFSDTGALAVTDAYAADNRLRAIGDLRRVAATMTLGGPTQFQQDPAGLPALGSVYGVTPAAFRALAVGDQYAALNSDAVQAADVNTTDGQLASDDYRLLRDPRGVFGLGNVVPVVSAAAVAAEGPVFRDTIERVDAMLTLATMRELNQAVDVSQLSPAAVARQFLETHGLLTPAA